MSHRQERFRELYSAHVDAVLGYSLRRVGRREDAGDIVAETFLVAWRRLADVPEGEGARLWLYGVARRTLAARSPTTAAARGVVRRSESGCATTCPAPCPTMPSP